MAEHPFDPRGYFDFDLAAGAIRARTGDRVVVLSGDVLEPLVSAAVQAQDLTAIRRLGRQLGGGVESELGGSLDDRGAEDVLETVAGALSVFGWGRLEVERWGAALNLRLANAPALDGDHLAVAALLGGLFSALSGQEVACVPVETNGSFLMVDPSIAEQVWRWSKGGDGVGAIVDRLAEAS
jgi:hypothetical protein